MLAYHSHNIAGTSYETNDHVALSADLEALAARGARIVPLGRVQQLLERGEVGSGPVEVALTFDDGPVFDAEDFVHPRHGPQRSFLNILRDFAARHPGMRPHATSFVIASPDARSAMERAEECGYTFLREWLTDRWWDPAARSGFIDIGNHSWDHVHSAPDRIATRSQERNDFSRVDNYEDADREIRAAADYIDSRVSRPCAMFAFPFGHVNDYLVRDYLPNRTAEHRMQAALGTGGREVLPGDSRWNIPRIVCGEHWRAPDQLRAILG